MKKVVYYFLAFVLFLIVLIIKINLVFVESDLVWDSSVYINTGKYIYSLGKSGLWEPSRPLVWPLIIGFFWKIGFDYIFWAKLISVFISMICVFLVYLISVRTFGKKTAFFTSMFFMLSPTFFNFGNIPISDIPSTLFLLIGIYFFMRKSHKLSGLFFGLSFMTRFFQVLFILPILLIYLMMHIRKKIKTKTILDFAFYFLAPVIPFLVVNYYLYKNPFYPFILQSFMTKYTGWVFYQPFSYYFINLVKENFLVLFSIIGVFLIIKKGGFEKRSLLLIFLIPFIVYIFIDHKEMRFIIPFFAFIYAFAVIGLLYTTDLFKENKKIVLIILLAIWFLQVYPQLKFNIYDDKLDTFYEYIKTVNKNEGIWISNPSFILFTDKKAHELVYYPLYSSAKAKELQAKADKARTVMINTCDILPCRPEDKNCLEETIKLMKLFEKNLNPIHKSKRENCEYFIFEK